MIRAVADTHTLLWYLYKNARLSPLGLKKIDEIIAAGDEIAISSITLVEIVYLVERRRIEGDSLHRVLDAIDREALFLEWPVDRRIMGSIATIPRNEVPDLPDRIIGATALCLDVPLLSADRMLRASRVPTIW